MSEVARHYDPIEIITETRLQLRYAEVPRITVLTPDAIDAIEPQSLGLVVASSVVQDLPPSDIALKLKAFHAWLAPAGKLIVADVIPLNVSTAHDALELLNFARQERFLPAAVSGLVRTAKSGYWSTRAKAAFNTFSESDFIALLRSHSFDAHRLERNFGHNQRRMAFEAHPTRRTQKVQAKEFGTEIFA